MQFRVITGPAPATYRNVVLLRHTGWDDWFKFSTLYNVTYVDADGAHHDIGGTKIGRIGLRPAGKDRERQDGFRYPDPPARFSLDPPMSLECRRDAVRGLRIVLGRG